jgi:succinate dehydrogenase/fumarate reductase flavoprotein subunit
MFNTNWLVNQIVDFNILVIGGGSAGCFADVKAKQTSSKVVFVDKG